MPEELAGASPHAVETSGASANRSPARTPRITLEVRLQMPGWTQALIIGGSVLVGLAISVLILGMAGVPASELASEFANSILDAQSFHAVLIQAAPLILVGVAASIGFQARFWNLGLEGQMVWGGIAATAISLGHVGPDGSRLALMAVAAMLGGMMWVTIPATLKYWCKVNEIIATLLLNYVATLFLYNLLYGAWKDPGDSFPHSAEYAMGERLPDIGFSINAALPIALVAMIAIWWLTQVSRFGFYLTFIHANEPMAGRVGVPTRRVTVAAILLSGALAALAGFVISAGQEGRLTQGFFEGYGFSGILIAFLARNNPLLAAIVAILIAMLFVVGQTLQIFYQIPFAMVQMIQAIIVMCVATSDFFIRHRINLHR